MTTYGIVVEGGYDAVTLAEIIKKCLLSEIEIIARPCGNKSSLMRKFPGFLEEFRYANQGTHVNKALVIRDADCKDPDELLEKMGSKITSRNYPFEVKFIIIVQELETWLLADEDAVSRVTGKTISRVNEDLQSIIQPKEKLKKILSDGRVAYTAEVAREIAKESDLLKIEYCCPGFKKFRQDVIDC